MEIKINGGRTVKEFLEKYKDKSVWHLAWSLYWRGWLLLVGFWFIVYIALTL